MSDTKENCYTIQTIYVSTLCSLTGWDHGHVKQYNTSSRLLGMHIVNPVHVFLYPLNH